MSNLRSPDKQGWAAGVPYIALAPANPAPGSPLVVVMHLMDPPRSKEAMAASLPLDGVDAWRVYLGLPMFGERMPAGGMDEVMRLLFEDALLNVMAPVVEQAARELPGAIADVRQQLGLTDGPLALVGGSAGGAAVLLALIENDSLSVAVAAVINPATRMTDVIAAGERDFGITYNWNDISRAKAASLDFVARASDLAARDPQTPLLFVIGEQDPIEGLPIATRELQAGLKQGYEDPDRVLLVAIAGLGHALAEEPGVEPAPQTVGAAQVDGEVTGWLQQYLRR